MVPNDLQGEEGHELSPYHSELRQKYQKICLTFLLYRVVVGGFQEANREARVSLKWVKLRALNITAIWYRGINKGKSLKNTSKIPKYTSKIPKYASKIPKNMFHKKKMPKMTGMQSA